MASISKTSPVAPATKSVFTLVKQTGLIKMTVTNKNEKPSGEVLMSDDKKDGFMYDNYKTVVNILEKGAEKYKNFLVFNPVSKKREPMEYAKAMERLAETGITITSFDSELSSELSTYGLSLTRCSDENGGAETAQFHAKLVIQGNVIDTKRDAMQKVSTKTLSAAQSLYNAAKNNDEL